MPTSADAVYLDTSALVKLVRAEAESAALRRYLTARPVRTSSALVRVELVRAARRHDAEAVAAAHRLLGAIDLITLDEGLLDAAALIGPEVRSLDAIHLASAVALGAHLAALVTYDVRMKAAAASLGLPVASLG